ncbi:hypothetical protein IAQ61_000007 [Plenodomus lingam]|uniref:Similar to FAD linked oxidase domain protein n=1 Tax=Leptosphaeria maculans (strain JN3 / isolate v23.1.3 / race Av1-4-5-6-7-8) TaxID=985895 RepID=E5R458_LEPMJ|nr:similar to FAD linked oxidase domain protein [Plenodomus lingam JN3]KAH9881285.1 hypothetical protein IAQ61_000007 [Plenodomus lingam]CBX91789.1 similar to FAD linked oxidase domain protein [Plenodomus lingam JN3]
MAPKFSKQPLLALLCLTSAFAWGQSDKGTAVHSCLVEKGVRAILSTDAGWANATNAFQQRIPRAPAAIAFPQNKDEVALALECARQASIKVSVTGRAHSFQGFGFGFAGNLVIDMDAFTDITFDESTKQLTCGGGVNIGPAAKFAYDKHHYHYPHVRGSHVGMAGSIFGGGFGTTSRLLGIPSQNLVSVEFMLANGTIVNATPGSDLLWAAQGAGPNFGVALSTTTKTFPVPYETPLNYTLSLGKIDDDRATAAAMAVQKWALDGLAPNELSLRFSLREADSTGFYYGDEASFDKALAPLVNSLNAIGINATVTKTIQRSFWDSEIAAAGPGMNDPQGGTLGGRASHVQSWVKTTDSPFTAEQLKLLISAIRAFNRTDMTRTGVMDLWAGDNNDVKDSEHAFAHGKNLWLVRVDGIGKDGVWPSDGIKYMHDLFKPFEAALKKAGLLRGFVNYVDSELSVKEWSSRLYGKNFAKLQQIKAAIDPSEMFSGFALAIPLPRRR